MLFRCIAAIPNSGGKCIEHFYEDTAAGHASAEHFARQYDKPGWGVYDCVSPLRDQRRTKDTVALIEGLHVDLDAYKAGKTKEEIIQRLQDELNDVGILSCINSSGRGVHALSLFREPIEAGTPEAERAQQVLKRLVTHLGADPQPTHFAALMRRPGTTNSRTGGGPCKKLLDFGTRCELSDVEAYLDLVSDKETLFPPHEPKTNKSDFPEYNGPVDVDARLTAMKFGDQNGAGVNATIPSVICSLIWRACHPDDIYERVFSAITQMVKRDGLQWDMVAEAEKTNERIRCAYHNVFEKEYDPSTGVIPVWLPMEFHEAWAAALAAGKRPTMSRNGVGWHIRSYTIGDKANGGNGTETNTAHPESAPGADQSTNENPKQNNSPKSPFILLPLNPFEPAGLPQRKFLFGKHYQRGTVSGTVAPGGTGKSSLEMVEFVSMASGIDLLNDKQPLDGGPLRVWYHNGEDPMDELKRRLAAICQHYDISLKDLLTSSNFFMTSGNEVPLRVAASYSQVQVQTDHRLVKCIAEQIGDNKIDAAGFDPLVTLHAVSEKDPGKMDGVIRIFAGIADTRNCAIDLSHHTRKLPPGSGDGDVFYDIDDARGVKAITDAMRAVRLLNYMSKQDAENAGLMEMERTSYFRIDRGKANYSAPAKTVTWRRFVNVDLPNGDAVGVITPWLFPGQDGVPSPERLEAERKAEHVFLEILRRRTLAGRFVNERGPYGAPTEFAKEREAKVAKVGKAALAAAMQRLFDRGKIRLEEYISSHRNKANKIVEA
jgi:RecA-family ATPase